MNLECLTSGVSRADPVEPRGKLAPSDGPNDIDLASSTSRLNDEHCPLIYRESEEFPRHDSDDNEPDNDGNRNRRGRRSLPIRYASHSSRDSSPASVIHAPVARDRRISDRPTVRLTSVLAKRRRDYLINDDVADDDLHSKKRKEELMQSQRGNRQVFDRNKRMFGMLMGTLKKFKTEETSREEVTLKRSRIDEKLESNEQSDPGYEPREPPITFSRNPDADKAERSEIIDKAEIKLDISGRFKNWASSHKHMAGFIQTETKPKIFWLPKGHNPETERQLRRSRDYFNLFMAERAAKCKKELEDVDKAPLRSVTETGQSRSRESSSTRSSDNGRRHYRRLLPRDDRSPASDTSSDLFRR